MRPRSESFFDGHYGRLLLPGVILQSVLIGGGYATGREIVQFGAKFGALGWIAGLWIAVGFGLMGFLTFEVARRFQAFDYRTLLRHLIGPLYWLFDIVYILLAILIIAIMAAATGEILSNTMGFNYWVGVILMIVIVALLNFHGEGLIEKFKSLGTLALYLGYILFATLVISDNGMRSRQPGQRQPLDDARCRVWRRSGPASSMSDTTWPSTPPRCSPCAARPGCGRPPWRVSSPVC